MTQTFSRKEFLRGGFLRFIRPEESLIERSKKRANTTDPEVHEIAFVRPPGAIAEAEFLAACTRCDDCIKACPHLVIRKAGPELGDLIAETPILLPHENPCLMCDGWPCTAVCETGALIVPKPEAFVQIGTARVNGPACYMEQGQPCDYCVKSCPTRPRSIEAKKRGSAALVHEHLCTGCGACAQLCPTGAIEIEDYRLLVTGKG